jgi:NIMA (never in mitosis gene a)-related kinase
LVAFIFSLSFSSSTLANKESEILSREQAIVEKEQHLALLLSHKDQEIASSAACRPTTTITPSIAAELEMSVKQAIVR